MRVVRSLVLVVALIAVMTGCLDRGDSFDTALQLQEDITTIDNYLASNQINAYKDKSGIRFVIHEFGTKGLPPRVDQAIKAKYVGKYLDGTVFDNGGDGAEGPLNGFILGWQYALSIWPAGTKATLYVPSPLGYGNKKNGNVPENSILTFEVELQEVVYSNAEKARLTSDIATIDDYLEDKNINAVEDTTGVRYVITDPGSGGPPQFYEMVEFKAIGKALSSGNQFFNGSSKPTTSFDSRVADYLHGIKVALMKVGEGGKITVYVPSGLAFGPYENTQSGLPANSNVYYEIELVDIVR